ncbi:MAG: hypothetical protein ABJE95_17480 [Byssovorax sp.]
MSIDAVALFRPKQPAALAPYLDLDVDSEESNGLYAEALDDGSVLVHTFQSYAAFESSSTEGRAWLAQFGEDLPLIHDDPRGLLFFPDVAEPGGRTYDAVVKEIGAAGIWIPATPLTAEEMAARQTQLIAQMEAIQRGETGDADDREESDQGAMPGFGMEGLPALAQQMMASLGLGSPEGPTDLQGMMEALQKQILGAMGGGAGGEGFEIGGGALDEGGFDGVVVLLQRTTPLVLTDTAEDDVNDVVTLADGTVAIHTTAVVAAREMVALRLAEEHADWVAEHHDARGVPSFGASHLDAIEGAATYEAALAALGDEVVFLKPKSIDELQSDKKAGLRKLVGGAT